MPLDEATEARARAHLDAGDAGAAADVLVRGYGGELFAFLVARLPTVEDAEDALQSFCEDVLRGLPSFRGASTLRTWCYAVARRRAQHVARGDGRRRRRITDGGTDAAGQLAWHVRTTTAAHLKTASKSELRALLRELDDDDQEIIALHAGLSASGSGELTFNEIAALLDETLAPADVAKRAATYRKRHERATERLRALYRARS